MTSESKILTVSYGTFSCTLEGFENPFDTMKAIAEYFRDLAAQDRHFGAEPPPPDAAMLHRLAEREVSRLAAAAGQRADAPKADAVVDRPVADPVAVAPRIQFNPVSRRHSRPADPMDGPVEDTVVAPEPSLQDVIPDGVAAKLARIRRAVHPVAADLTPPAPAPMADPAEADPEAAMPAMNLAEDESAVEQFEDVAADPVVEDVFAAEAPAAESPAGEAPDVAAVLGALIANDDSPAEEAFADEVAADETTAVRAIDADSAEVAAAAFHDADTEPTAVEAQIADTPDAAFEIDIHAEAEAETGADADDLADLVALDGVVSDGVAPDAAAFDEAALAAALDDPLPEDGAPEPAMADAVSFDAEPEAAAEPIVEIAAEADVAPVADVVPEPEVAAAAQTVVEAPLPTPAVADKRSGRSRRVNSRVIRLHPDDQPGASDPSATRVLSRREESEEVARLMQQAEEVMAEDENRRRQEALSRLKAAVQSTEADRADLDYEAPRADASLDPYRDDLAEAIQPDEPQAPPAPAEVKPTRRKSVSIRPAAEPRPGSIRPGMISPPPLVLVSEQRIDRVAPAAGPAPAPAPAAAPSMSPAMPGIAPTNPDGQSMVAVRTGRLSGAIGAGAAVASGAPARNIVLDKPSYGPAVEAEEDEDLAEDSREINETALAAFAENVGAKSMAEMLEAAAAYATCVENRSQFTRPQLMRRMMASAGGKQVSREDGLRSFGTLLRTGRIEKVTRGHYSLADNSPYLAEARRLT